MCKVYRKTRCAHSGYKQNATRNDDVTKFVWKWRNRLTLDLNVAENTNYMKKTRLYCHFVPLGHTANAYYYKGVLEKLIRVHIPRKRQSSREVISNCTMITHRHILRKLYEFFSRRKRSKWCLTQPTAQCCPSDFFCTQC